VAEVNDKNLNKYKMGAYDNPTIIQDLYGAKAWAEAAAGVTQTVVQQMAERRKRFDKLQEEAEKAANLRALAWNETALTENEDLNTALDTYASKNLGKNQTIIEQARLIGEGLLNGSEAFGMGAIEAKTLLRTETGLTRKEREKYQDIVNISDNFQSRMKNAAGVIGADVEVIKGMNPAEIENYFWQGETMADKTGSQFAGIALAEKRIEGVTSTKTLNHRKGADGRYQNILTVDTKIKRSHDLIKDIAAFQNSDDYKEDENGYITIHWERDLNRWEGGVLEELIAGTNYDEINEQTKITKPNGKLSNDVEVNLGMYSEPTPDGIKLQYKNKIWIDKDKIENTFVNSAAFQGRLAALRTMQPGELQAYIEQRLEIGAEFKINEFLKLSPKEQEAALAEFELNAYSNDMGIKLGKNEYAGQPGFNLEYNKLTAADIAALDEKGVDVTKMEEWQKGMTEDKNPNAYAYFSIENIGNLTSNPNYVPKDSAQYRLNTIYNNFLNTKEIKGGGYKAGTVLIGGRNNENQKRRIFWNNQTNQFEPQVFINLQSGVTTWSSDASLTGGMQPNSNKNLFQLWLFPERKFKK